jgi:hypothetical protein
MTDDGFFRVMFLIVVAVFLPVVLCYRFGSKPDKELDRRAALSCKVAEWNQEIRLGEAAAL